LTLWNQSPRPELLCIRRKRRGQGRMIGLGPAHRSGAFSAPGPPTRGGLLSVVVLGQSLLLLLHGGPDERDGRSRELCQSSGSPCTAVTAPTGRVEASSRCPLWGIKRTSLGERVMSAPDPKRTSRGLKSRSATVSCWRAILSAPARETPKLIQNNSGLRQGLAGTPAAG
jgi:hypothetical protein